MDLPRDKADIETAMRLEEHSCDELEPFLGELLEWAQDFNWPVAKVLCPLLAKSDARIVPHVRAVLAGEDDVWKYWTLSEVVAHLCAPVRDQLMSEVARIVSSPSPGEKREEVDVVARDIMVRHNCASST